MSDSFTDSTPASDDDPYSSSSESSYTIDTSNYPKPIPIIGPLLGFNDKLFAQISHAKIEQASARLKRPLTADEASAISYWGAKQISIISYGTPIGVAAGLWRCWDTRARFRFPFYGPNMATFNPMQFPNGIVFLNGPKAPIIWHVFRALFYAGFGKFAGNILTGSYAMSVGAVGELGDPRLKNFRDQLLGDAKAKRPVRPGSRTPQYTKPVGRQSDQAGVMSETEQYDDASPSGGMLFEQTTESSNIPEKVQPEFQRSGQWRRPSQVNNEGEDLPFGLFDDASPTGGQADSPEAQSTTAQSTGSAWDRIRSGQRPAPTPQRQNPPARTSGSQTPRENAWAKQRAQNGASSDDGFSSSSLQEDRIHDRGEAQREFDAKIERERKGGDFATGSGDQKRW